MTPDNTSTMHYELVLAPIGGELIDAIIRLSEVVFGTADADHGRWRLTRMPDVSVWTLTEADELIAFKAGYAMSGTKYYSWLGGVHPEHRRRGIAAELMTRQHDWLRSRGYALVETATNQDNHAMARVNLQHGFSISGMRTAAHANQILFLKELGETS